MFPCNAVLGQAVHKLSWNWIRNQFLCKWNSIGVGAVVKVHGTSTTGWKNPMVVYFSFYKAVKFARIEKICLKTLQIFMALLVLLSSHTRSKKFLRDNYLPPSQHHWQNRAIEPTTDRGCSKIVIGTITGKNDAFAPKNNSGWPRWHCSIAIF